MHDGCPDLWGVWANLDRIRANLNLPLLKGWREQHLKPLEADLDKPLEFPGEAGDVMRKCSEHAQMLGFAHVLTGDDRFARRGLQALEYMLENDRRWDCIAHNEMYPQDTADLITSEVTKAGASALSFLWPELGPGLRGDLVSLIAQRGGKPIYDGAVTGCWWGNALNSNWTAVLNSGLAFAALVLRESDPATAALWLDFAISRCREMLDLAAEEGAGIEGAGYWLYCFGSLQDLVEATRNVTGEDLYEHPFWQVCSRFLPYIALPDMSGWVNYADTSYRGLSGSQFFHGVASRVGDSLAQGFGNDILRRYPAVNWKSLIYYDQTVPEQPVRELPPCRVFHSIHLASLRGSWHEDAPFMLFKGGSNAWSHTHLDLNSFFITGYGERLATEPGPEHYSLAYWHSIQPPVSTAWHNCIVVDGAHQRVSAQYAMSYDLEEAGDCYSRITDHVSTHWLEMLRGDATTAYADMLSRAWRDVMYIKPNVFVIFDDLIGHPVRAQRNFEWFLHSECSIEDTDYGMVARGERGELRIEPVFPVAWEHKHVEGRNIPYAGHKPMNCISIRPPWRHKWNENPARSEYPHWDPRGDAEPLFDNTCKYLVVLSVLKAGAEPRFALEPLESGNARGLRLIGQGEEFMVVFNHDGGLVTLGDLTTDAEKVVLRDADGDLDWRMVRGRRLEWQGKLLDG